jgi:hypothetical protein
MLHSFFCHLPNDGSRSWSRMISEAICWRGRELPTSTHHHMSLIWGINFYCFKPWRFGSFSFIQVIVILINKYTDHFFLPWNYILTEDFLVKTLANIEFKQKYKQPQLTIFFFTLQWYKRGMLLVETIHQLLNFDFFPRLAVFDFYILSWCWTEAVSCISNHKKPSLYNVPCY